LNQIEDGDSESTEYRVDDDRPQVWTFGTFEIVISVQRVIRSTSYLVLRGVFFWGQQIEWRYFRLNQIQDGNSESTEYRVDERRDNDTQPVKCCEHCR